ncbi:isoflavone reductase family protein [Exophiala viscosa]|uniref:isoflavone reductase family protein n=1 Tax=Exophiala viscosa TaxID=2486360 RepID=UPI00218F419C|nr:isoflavone reductase family protein [Exophiala viscosa]
MSKTKVLLLGATGETGASILEGLARDGSFDISIAVRPASADKPAVRALADRGFSILSIDLSKKVNASVLTPFDTVISSIGPESQQSQLNFARAAKAAGVTRFVPCGFITVCPPGGIMALRDAKEEVYNLIFKLHLPYTIIDTGFWHQISFPPLPSGKLDEFHFLGENKLYGDGNAPNLLTDLRDIGPFVARIIRDPRTLNKKVFTWSDELSQNEIYALAEKLSGESIDKKPFSLEEIEAVITKAKQAVDADPTNIGLQMGLWSQEYNMSKYYREDNTRKVALYLGYLDARELYPDFKPITFEEYFKEILEGKGNRPYAGRF